MIDYTGPGCITPQVTELFGVQSEAPNSRPKTNQRILTEMNKILTRNPNFERK